MWWYSENNYNSSEGALRWPVEPVPVPGSRSGLTPRSMRPILRAICGRPNIGRHAASLRSGLVRSFRRPCCSFCSRELRRRIFRVLREAASGASQACLQAVLKAGIESLDAGAPHVVRDGKRYRRVDPTLREIMTSAGRIEYLRPRYRSDGKASIVPIDEQVRLADSFCTELAAEQAMFMLSSLSPPECVSLYEKFRIDGASLSSMQRLAEVAGEHWDGCKEPALCADSRQGNRPGGGGDGLNLAGRNHAADASGGERRRKGNGLEGSLRRHRELL